MFLTVSALCLCVLLTGCGGGNDDDYYDDYYYYDDYQFPDNGPPPLIAHFDGYEGQEDTVLQVDELFGLLSNDEYPVFETDIEFPLSTVNNGDLEVFSDGSFIYEPRPGFLGPDSFTYTLITQDGRRSSAEVRITVYPVNFRMPTEMESLTTSL